MSFKRYTAARSDRCPVALFDGPYRLGSLDAYHSFDIAGNGRFLMVKEGTDAESEPPPVIVIQNWVDELEPLVPIEP